MSPLDKAKQFLDLVIEEANVQGVSLPSVRYAQLGDLHVSCEAVVVAVGPLTPATTPVIECGAVQTAAFQCVIVRECVWPANDDGTDDPAAVAEVSALIDKDANVLWAVGNDYKPFGTKSFTVSWQIEGGLGITILTITTGID